MIDSSNEISGRKVSVIGAARSGTAAAALLARLGAIVTLSDTSNADKLGAERVLEIEATGVAFALGASVEQALPEGTEIVVVSPGVPKEAPVLQAALARGIRVWGEIEFAFRVSMNRTHAITGTNGKTTTTLLLAAMMLEDPKFPRPTICGNISADEVKCTMSEAVENAIRPEYLDEDDPKQREAYLIAEISSFQLEWVDTFSPKVAVLTNITPDHLNRHKSFEEYAGAKAKLFTKQTKKDWAVLNYDDLEARKIGVNSPPAKVLWFSTLGTPPGDFRLWIRKGFITARLNPRKNPTLIMPISEIPETLPGAHSLSNILAAAGAAMAAGVSPVAIAKAVRAFKGVPHRMEIVADIRGVRYLNNSMCTNVAAAISSLSSMERPTIVICGGADKEIDFSPLVPTLKTHARQVILIGATSDKMKKTFEDGGYDSLIQAASLEEAVVLASKLAVPGDAVLLSPACASFDQFRDFEHRGQVFRRAVEEL